MESSEIESRVAKHLKPFLKPEISGLKPGDLLKDHIDSLSVMELIFRLEEEFGISIDDTKIKQLETFADLLCGVEKLVNPPGQNAME